MTSHKVEFAAESKGEPAPTSLQPRAHQQAGICPGGPYRSPAKDFKVPANYLHFLKKSVKILQTNLTKIGPARNYN